MTADRSKPSLREQLAELQREMEEDPSVSDELFFFPTHEGVQGYWGTDPVWFVGQKPSKGGPGFPDRAVTLLYETLADHGFENAHITDITALLKSSRPDTNCVLNRGRVSAIGSALDMNQSRR